MKIFNNPYMWTTFLVASLSANPTGVLAAPGPIADSPLFLSSAAQPNIFFLIDDSGSMGWEVLKSNGALAAHPSNSKFPNRGNMDFSPNDFAEDREHCVGYNVTAYNPRATYKPWSGVDINGNPYQDQTLSSALKNPFNPAAGSTNLSTTLYGAWNDANGDSVYQASECPIGSAPNQNFSSRTFTASGWVPVSSLPLITTATPNNTPTNYANWYSYYRKRNFIAKGALSDIIASSTARAGLGSLHNHKGIGTEIRDIDDLTLPVDATAQQNKSDLMRQLFRVDARNGTPLRRTLRNTGEYFKKGSNAVGNLFGGATPASPILPEPEGGACQQNFTILMSDGTWNGSSPGVGNTDADGAGPWDGGAHADGRSNTLADVAMKYYEEDLAPTLPNDVPTSLADSNDEQHMVTYTVAFGLDGTLTADPTDRTTPFAWPKPTANNIRTIDDMRHAAFNSRGQFLSAKDPQQLASSLQAAISNIQSRTGTAAAVSFNSTSVQTNSKVFLASFNSTGWHGNLEALNLSATGTLTPDWDAASLLNARDLTNDPRQIVTYNGSDGIAFEWPANYTAPGVNLSTTQISDLLSNAPHPISTVVPSEIAANNVFGENILEYLRGDFTNEGTSTSEFRSRSGNRLGDIVHASPFFVGQPNTPYPDALEGPSNLYSTFKTAQASRQPRLYAGANDGMLHVFNAGTSGTPGEEVFAYIPGLVFSSNASKGLHALAEQTYNHNYYVDLAPSVADVFIDTDGIGSGSPASWKTILVGGLRGGGKGIFALDITNPNNLTEANAADIPLWEFTHPDLGFTFSEIQIARLNNGKWAAIFGNGYNSDPSGDGRAKLFIHYLDGTGTIILDTQVGSIDAVTKDCSNASSDCNGLSTPALADLNGDAIFDRVYAGDLHGNLWVFDISDANSGSWSSAYQDASGSPNPLFQACSGASCTIANRQPITSKPTVTHHPRRSSFATSPNVLVYVGTGQYLTSTDNQSAAPQSFYGVWDGGTFGLAPRTSPLTRSDLVTQTITEPNTGQRILTQNPVNYSPNAATPQYGWKIDLPTSKERVVVDSTAIGSILFFNTLIPSTSICSGGGSSFLMTVDALTGGLPNFAVLDLDEDNNFSNDPILGGIATSNVASGSRFIKNGKGKYIRVTGGAGSTAGSGSADVGHVDPTGDIDDRRISWRHLDY